MKIQDHQLSGSGVSFSESPNHGGKYGDGLPDSIVIHYTAGSSADSSVKTLCDPNTKASAHVVVAHNGEIIQLVPFDTIAWHAGKSRYEGRTGFNKYSIGIEIDNAGRLTKSGSTYTSWFGRTYAEDDVVEAKHRNETQPSYWHRYTEEQITAVQDLCDLLINTYQINQILGHEEIAPNRKSDPGPAFPLDTLRSHLLNKDRAEEGDAYVENIIHQKGIVTAAKLNIREQPNYQANTTAAPLKQGTVVEILNESNGWCEVEAKIHGWVKQEYIAR